MKKILTLLLTVLITIESSGSFKIVVADDEVVESNDNQIVINQEENINEEEIESEVFVEEEIKTEIIQEEEIETEVEVKQEESNQEVVEEIKEEETKEEVENKIEEKEEETDKQEDVKEEEIFETNNEEPSNLLNKAIKLTSPQPLMAANKTSLYFDWGDDEVEYNGQDQKSNFINAPKAYTNALKTNKAPEDAVTWSLNQNSAKDVGTYTLVANYDPSQYKLGTLVNGSHNYQIKPKEIKAKWEAQEFPYNLEIDYYERFKPTVDGVIGNDTVNVSYDVYSGLKKVTSATNIGSYTVIASIDNENYKLENGTNIITIAKGKVILYWPEKTTYEYKGSSYLDTFKPIAKVYIGLNEVDAPDGLIDINVIGEVVNVGECEISVTLNDSNFEFSNLNKKTSQTYTITKKDLSIDWNQTTFVYNGQDQTSSFNPILKGICNEEITYEVTNNNTAINCGDYPVTITIEDTSGNNFSNYNKPTTLENTYHINKKDLTLDWGEYSGASNHVTYSGTNKLADYTIISNDIVDDEISISLNINEAIKHGTYTLKVTLQENKENALKNYNVKNDASRQLIIDQKDLSIDWGKFLLPTTSLVYDGKNKLDGYTVGSDDIVNADENKISFELDKENICDVGQYTINVTVNGNEEANYKIVGPTSKNIIVTKKPITIDWKQFSNLINYDTYDGSNKLEGFKLETDGFETLDNDKVSLELNKTEAIELGTYVLTASIIGERAFNYDILTGYNNRTLIIGKKNIYVIWNTLDSSINVYNGLSHRDDFKPLVYSDEGTMTLIQVEPENLEVTKFNGETLTEDNGCVLAGTYTVEVTFDETRYDVHYLDGSNTHAYTILPKQLSFDWNNIHEYVYTGEDFLSTFTPELKGVIDSDINDIELSVTVNDSSLDEIKDAGTYKIEASVKETKEGLLNNYIEPLNTKQTYLILKKPLYIDWISYTNHDYIYNGLEHNEYFIPKVYTNSDKTIIEEVDNLVGMEIVSAIDTKGNDMPLEDTKKAINAGTYKVKATLNSEYDNNYKIINIFESHDYEIYKRTVRIDKLDSDYEFSFVYNEQEQKPNSIELLDYFTYKKIDDFKAEDYTIGKTRKLLSKEECQSVDAGTYVIEISLNDGFYLNNCFFNNAKDSYARFVIFQKPILFNGWKGTTLNPYIITKDEHTLMWRDGKAFYDSYILEAPEANFKYYDGDTKQFVELDSSKIEKGENKDYKVVTLKSLRDAGKYDAWLVSESGSNYLIVDFLISHELEILPKEVSINWLTSIDANTTNKLPYTSVNGMCEGDMTIIEGKKVLTVVPELYYDDETFNVPQDAGYHFAKFTRFKTVSNDKDCNNYVLKENTASQTSYVIYDHESYQKGEGYIVTSVIKDPNIEVEKIKLVPPTTAQVNDLLKALEKGSDSDKELFTKITKAIEEEKWVNLYLKAKPLEQGQTINLPNDVSKNNVVLLDISLYACIEGDDTEYQITETGKYRANIEITLNPTQASKARIIPSRETYLIRYHEQEEASVIKLNEPNINGVAPNKTYTFNFSSNKFSVYGIYTKPKKDNYYPRPKLFFYQIPNTGVEK